MNNYWNNEEYNRAHGPNQDTASPEPPRTPGEQLAAMATFTGIFSIAASFVMPLFTPGILASLTIILAIISRGREPKMPKASRKALLLGIIGLVVHMGFLCATGITAYRIIHDTNTRSITNEILTQRYGYSLDDLLRAIESGDENALEILPEEDA